MANQFILRNNSFDLYPNFDPRPTTDLSKAVNRFADMSRDLAAGCPVLTEQSPHDAHLNCLRQVIRLTELMKQFQETAEYMAIPLMPLYRDYAAENWLGKWVMREDTWPHHDTEIFKVGKVEYSGCSEYGATLSRDNSAPSFCFGTKKGKIDFIIVNPLNCGTGVNPNFLGRDELTIPNTMMEPEEVVTFLTKHLKRTTTFYNGWNKDTNKPIESDRDEFLKVLNGINEV